MFIKVDDRIALITRKYNNDVWKLKFVDNNEVVNVFYSLDHKWDYVFLKQGYAQSYYS